MLYLDKLAMLAVLDFALLLAWMTVPPSDLYAKLIKALPLKESATLGATYEFKLPTTVDAKCAIDCGSIGFDATEQATSAEQREKFARVMRIAYSAYVTPLHR